MQIISIQIGQPQTLHTPDPTAIAHGKAQASDSAPWTSGIFKQPVTGAIFVGETNLAGDGQADLKNHGGPDKAICVYAHEHYAHWQAHYQLAEMPTGAFGENFTTTGLREDEMCIGDTLRVGNVQDDTTPDPAQGSAVIVQLSQPRQPCWKLARRWQLADFTQLVQETGYTGWYFRVLQTGTVQAGDALHLLDRPYPHLTLAEANRVMHHDKEDWETIAALLQCPLLSASWQNSLRRRVNLHAPTAIADRIYRRA